MNTKPTLATNPKDAVGVSKWRQYFCVPYRVMWEVGVGMLEGAMKYGRFNYRITGVQASIYIDATRGHIDAWCEGQDDDPDTGLSHITKAICSLLVLRDGMIEGNFVDDRAPRHQSMDEHTKKLQGIVDGMFKKYPEPKAPLTETDRKPSIFEPLVDGVFSEVVSPFKEPNIEYDPNIELEIMEWDMEIARKEAAESQKRDIARFEKSIQYATGHPHAPRGFKDRR